MDSNCASASRSEKRKREIEPGAEEKQSKTGTSFTRKETEVNQLIDSLGELIEKNVKNSTGSSEKKELSLFKKKNVELESKIMTLKAEIYDAKEALMQCKLEKEEGKSSALVPDQLLIQVEDLKKRVKSQKAQLVGASQTEKKLQDEIESLRADHSVAIEVLASANIACTEELKRAKQDLRSADSRLTEQQNTHLQQTQTLQTENKHLQEALEKKTAEHEFLSKAFKATKDMNEAIMQKSLPLQAEKAQLLTQLTSLTAEHEAAQVEHMSHVNALTVEIAQLKSALALTIEEKVKFEKAKNEIELQFLRLKHGPVLPEPSPSSGNTFVPVIPPSNLFQTKTLTINSTDDVSVLSDTTHFTDRRAAATTLTKVASPSRRVVLTTSSDTTSATADPNGLAITTSFSSSAHASSKSLTSTHKNVAVNKIAFQNPFVAYKAVLITTSHLVDIPNIRAEAAKLGNIVQAYVLTDGTGYLVEFDSSEDASLAVYRLHKRVIDGATLTCVPYITPMLESAAFGSSAHSVSRFDQDKARTDDKPHLRQVYILHNAPEKDHITPQSLRSELKRYGEVLHLKRLNDHPAYLAEFALADDARLVIRNLVTSMNGFRIYCRSHFNHLPPTGVEPDTRADMERNPDERPVILHDPALSEPRAVRRSDDSVIPKWNCQMCFDAGRINLVKTHPTEKCKFVHGTQKFAGRNSVGERGSASNSSGRSDSRERVRDPRPRVIERERPGSSTNRSSDQRSATDSEIVDKRDGEKDLIVNGQVRPLSSKR